MIQPKGNSAIVWFIGGLRLFAACLSVGCLLAGCAKQAEGERCDTSNGSLDCEAGLICKDYTSLGLSSEGDLQGAALCCPRETNAGSGVCGGSPELPPDDGVPEEMPDAGGTGGGGGVVDTPDAGAMLDAG